MNNEITLDFDWKIKVFDVNKETGQAQEIEALAPIAFSIAQVFGSSMENKEKCYGWYREIFLHKKITMDQADCKMFRDHLAKSEMLNAMVGAQITQYIDKVQLESMNHGTDKPNKGN